MKLRSIAASLLIAGTVLASATPALACTAPRPVTLSGTVTVHPRNTAYETVTVRVNRCITDVSAYASNADSSDTVWSVTDHSHSTRHVLRLAFTRIDVTGRWELDDVFYQSCGSRVMRDLIRWPTFPHFTVRHS